MIDEKKLIEALLHDGGTDFAVRLPNFSPEAVGNTFQEFADKMKEGFINLINAQPKVENWISTKERLPNIFESVLLHVPDNTPLPTVHEGYLTRENIWISMNDRAYTMEEVPFWMPMPEPPEAGGGA